MNDLFCIVSIQQDADYVEADEWILRIFGDERFGRTFKKPLLTSVHSLFRETKIKVCTGFDLYYYDHIVLLRNDIYLLFAAPPVTMKNNITFI